MIPVGANLISGEFNIQQRVERWKELNITRTSETKGYDKKRPYHELGSNLRFPDVWPKFHLEEGYHFSASGSRSLQPRLA